MEFELAMLIGVATCLCGGSSIEKYLVYEFILFCGKSEKVVPSRDHDYFF